MEKYLVSFGDHQEIYDGEELRNFIEVAVIKNKDIHNFKVNRLEAIDVDVDEYGQASYMYDFKEYESNEDYALISLIISELADYSLKSNYDNILEKLDRIRKITNILTNPTIKDQFEVAALRIIISKLNS